MMRMDGWMDGWMDKRKPLEVQGVLCTSAKVNKKAASVIAMTEAAPVCEVFMSRRRAIARDPPSFG